MISALTLGATQDASPPSLHSLLAPQLQSINACIGEKMQSSVSLIPQIAGYLISLGGKRLRPLLTVATAELCGYQGQRHIQLAASVEFIHTATLLHDDVVDESLLRRGMKTANTVWSDKASVLVGDFLFTKAFELMVLDGSLEVLQILSQAASTIAEGEVLQLSSSHDLTLDEETYLRIIGSKTACLFAAATEVGAVIAAADESTRTALSRFGYGLGMAFQLIDDCLDYTADQDKLGKAIGDDFREGKVTLPIIYAYQDGTNKPFWEEVFHQDTPSDKALNQAIHLLQTSGALLKTQQKALAFIDEALECLTIFPDSPLKTALQDLAQLSVVREG